MARFPSIPRRALAALLLPGSLLPVVLLAPTLARAPATLMVRLERAVAPAHRTVHHGPPEPHRYPVGAARLEVDAFAPVAGVLTPRVGISPLAEYRSAAEEADKPLVLVARGPEAEIVAPAEGDSSGAQPPRALGRQGARSQ